MQNNLVATNGGLVATLDVSKNRYLVAKFRKVLIIS